jgi:DNA-binding transcriptional ArsR family regulator
MRARPSQAKLIRLRRVLKSYYSFCLKDIARVLRLSSRSAERYLAKLLEIDAVELRYKGTDRYYYYRVRRNK